MYITAQRVSSEKEQGINTILYEAPADVSWRDQRDAVLDNGSPGEVVRQICSIPPGGNRVRSYLDVVAPDSTKLHAIVRAVMTHPNPENLSPFCWERGAIWCRFRSTGPGWKDEICALLSRIVNLLGDQRRPRFDTTWM